MLNPSLRPATANTEADTFAAEVLRGLTRPTKTLPCRYICDARGSELFERITRLRAYAASVGSRHDARAVGPRGIAPSDPTLPTSPGRAAVAVPCRHHRRVRGRRSALASASQNECFPRQNQAEEMSRAHQPVL